MAINFAGMLLVACKRYMLLIEMLISYVEIKKKTRCKYRHSEAVEEIIISSVQDKIIIQFLTFLKENQIFVLQCCRLMHYLLL